MTERWTARRGWTSGTSSAVSGIIGRKRAVITLYCLQINQGRTNARMGSSDVTLTAPASPEAGGNDENNNNNNNNNNDYQV